MEASPGCGAEDMATVRESRNRPLCNRGNHSLSLVVCENRDIKSVGAGRSVTRMARLPSLCIPSSSAAVGNFALDSTVQSQSITCYTWMASQALVFHAFESFGGQTMATSRICCHRWTVLSGTLACLQQGFGFGRWDQPSVDWLWACSCSYYS